MFSRYPKILTRLVGPGDLRLHVSPLMDLQHRWRLQATSPAGHNMATWVGKKPPTIWGGVLDLKLGKMLGGFGNITNPTRVEGPVIKHPK